jgi:site-specific recombinase XerD
VKKAVPTFKVFLHESQELKDGSHPVKIRLTYQRSTRRFSTNLSATAETWGKAFDNSPRGKFREFRQQITELEKQIQQQIDSLHPFSFEGYKELLHHKKEAANPKDVYSLFAEVIEQTRTVGTAQSYTTALNAFKSYKPKLSWQQLTPRFLEGFKQHMLDKGRSITTVGIYTRPLKAVYNEAIKRGYTAQERYPFGRGKFVTPKGKGRKIALNDTELQKLFSYTPENDKEAKALALWQFMYLCNGINTKDVCLLKWKDVSTNRLQFIREKSKHYSPEPLIVELLPESQAIIELYGQADRRSAATVFNLVDYNRPRTPTALREAEKDVYAKINEQMKLIAPKAGIDKNITTYVARHSFATKLMRQGYSIEFISKAIGHANITTTANYLAGFEQAETRKAQSSLLQF